MLAVIFGFQLVAQKKNSKAPATVSKPAADQDSLLSENFRTVKFRCIGPYRGGRSVTSTGVKGNPLLYYMGTTGGGVWKTENAGASWKNISDGYFNTGSVGAVAVSESDPNVVFVGMGEHAPRGVMTSYGDGIYKSTDAGKTWKHIGLEQTRHISWIRIHPSNPDIVYVGAQGAIYGPNPDRGVYKSTDGGATWRKVLYVNDSTGCADLDMDMNNPRILYAAMWDYQRKPWEMRSGGKGSGLYKSTDGGETWKKLENGIPIELGKMSIAVSRANSNKVFALIESDTQKELGGLFVSNDGGDSFDRISKDHRLTQRAWYYIEVFADPQNENTVYVLNSPGLKSTDGGKSWTNIRGTHGDFHQLWINPANSQNMIISNDGGAAVTFNGGANWSTQANQPTAQFYRVNADNLFPYNIYGGQQDNSSVKIASKSPSGYSITERDWTYTAGGESAFLAFNPDSPNLVMGGSYQGTIDLLDVNAKEDKPIMAAPIQYQALKPKDMKYRFNWNAPIVYSMHEPNTFYHGANVLLKTSNGGKTWSPISGDLTRNDSSKQGMSGTPYTNEGAGGENYGTLAYVAESKLEKGVIYTGSDDGYVQLTKDGGATWTNITPAGLQESIINCIEVSPHDKATVYIAATAYKFNNLEPLLFKSNDYGKTWTKIVNGIAKDAFTRCIREDTERKGLLFAGTETGLCVSWNEGANWQQLQLGLPITPVTDLKIHKGDLLAATMGRAFWVLDDLHMLRQYNANDSLDAFVMYKPEDAMRVSGRSMLDNVDDDTKASAVGPAGTGDGVNAATGAVIYYRLPAAFKEGDTLTLDVIDGEGLVVRSYSSKADPLFVSYSGGPSADPLLPPKPGLNRFVWDLRYATMKGVPNVFIEGDFSGRKVAPGAYLLRLRMGKLERTAPVRVLPHPMIKATKAEYVEQQAWQKKVEDKVNQMHYAVLDMRSVRKQIAEIKGLTKDDSTYKEINLKGQAIIDKLTKWEDEIVQNKAESNDDIINYVNKLSADFIFLHGEMDCNIPYVTDGQKQRFEDLHEQWEELEEELKGIISTDIAEYNKMFAAKNAGRIIIPNSGRSSKVLSVEEDDD